MRKQKFLKRILTAALAVLTAAACCVNAFAATYKINEWEYSLNSDSTVTICGVDDDVTELIFPNKIGEKFVTAIGTRAFAGRTDVTSVSFLNAKNIKTIGMSAFSGCTGITELALSYSITTLKMYAFYGCTGLETLSFGANVTTVPEACFYGCSSLGEVKLPSSVTTIGEMAFTDCTAMRAITIPKSVTSIADNAFLRDDSLVIYCYKGSYAHTYAEENGIDYELIDAYHRGDINRDGAVSIDDATLLQKYLARVVTLDDEQLLLADADNNGAVNVKDVTAIQKHIVGIAAIVD